jgi:hypothetical protein
VVARNRGCLTSLTPQSQRLLGLRAGIGGPSHSAGATARILHIGTQRESLLEQASLLALSTACGASWGSAGQEPAASHGAASTGVSGTSPSAGPTLVSSVSYLRGAAAPVTASSPAAGPAAAQRAAKRGSRANGGSQVQTSTPPPLAPQTATLPGESSVRAAAVNQNPRSAVLAVVVLGLLLAAVVLGQPWRRRRTAVATASPAGAAPAGAAPASAAPAAATMAAAAPAAAEAPPRAAAQERPASAAQNQPASAVQDRPESPAQAAPASALPQPQPQPQADRRGMLWLREHATQAALVVTAVAGIVARSIGRRSRSARRR